MEPNCQELEFSMAFLLLRFPKEVFKESLDYFGVNFILHDKNKITPVNS